MTQLRTLVHLALAALMVPAPASAAARPTIVRDPYPPEVMAQLPRPAPAIPGATMPGPGIALGRADLIAAAGSDTVYFGPNEFRLTGPAQATLAAQARWLLANPFVRVRIEGHSDDFGTREHSLAMGERRASAVRDFLLSQGVAAARISVLSWGKERPAGATGTSVALDRRAITVILR